MPFFLFVLFVMSGHEGCFCLNTQEVNELTSMGRENLTVSPYKPFFFSGKILVHTHTVEKSSSVPRKADFHLPGYSTTFLLSTSVKLKFKIKTGIWVLIHVQESDVF